jgi:hypothetical protein
MSDPPPLYIFVHINKCAGTTFAHHIAQNLEKDEYVRAYALSTYYNIVTGKEDHYEGSREKIRGYVRSLNADQKSRVKVLYGHDVEPALAQEFAPRPICYLTFLREPSTRLVSHFNYHRYCYQKGLFSKSMQEQFLLGLDTFPTLADYVGKAMPDNYMTRFLCGRFLSRELPKGPLGSEYLEAAQRILDDFFFVGVSEHYDRDAPYLYQGLGVHQIFDRQNVSAELNPAACRLADWPVELQAVAAERNTLDRQLYAYALELNRRFRDRLRYKRRPWNIEA